MTRRRKSELTKLRELTTEHFGDLMTGLKDHHDKLPDQLKLLYTRYKRSLEQEIRCELRMNNTRSE